MNYPHMCRMDHDEIGYRGDGERCPVCVATDDLAARDRELAEACELLEMAKMHMQTPGALGHIHSFLARRESGSAKGEGT